MSAKAEVLQQLEQLIETGERLGDSFSIEPGSMVARYRSSESETALRSFYTSAIAALGRISGDDNDYYRSVPELPTKGSLSRTRSHPSFIPAVTGALIALRDSVRAGYLESLESRLTANIHDDLLEQARTLLASGYHVASMVIAGGVLENHLRKLVTTRSLSWNGSGSLTKYNDLLKDSTYPQPVWRRIQSVADIRNDAAHGNVAAVATDDVKDALGFVSRIMTDYST